jgi:hypothetical protein
MPPELIKKERGVEESYNQRKEERRRASEGRKEKSAH